MPVTVSVEEGDIGPSAEGIAGAGGASDAAILLAWPSVDGVLDGGGVDG